MGKKKRKDNKPWCWYCDREFEDEKVLIDHQRIKHFKCTECGKKLNTAGGMVVHMQQVHKQACTAVSNALPGRESVDIEIFGMEGVPEADLQAHLDKISGGGNSGKRQKVDVGALTPDQIQRQMAEFKKQQQQMTPYGNMPPVPPMGMPGMPPPQQGPYGMPQPYPNPGQGYPPASGFPPGPPFGGPPYGMPPPGPYMPQGPYGPYSPRPGMPPPGMPPGMPPYGAPPFPNGPGPGPGPNPQWGSRPPLPLPPRPAPPPHLGASPIGAGPPASHPPPPMPQQPQPPSYGYNPPLDHVDSPVSATPAAESKGVHSATPLLDAQKASHIVYSDSEISVEEKRALHPKYAYHESPS